MTLYEAICEDMVANMDVNIVEKYKELEVSKVR